MQLEFLPAYAPELNPVEGFWSDANHSMAGYYTSTDIGSSTTALAWCPSSVRDDLDPTSKVRVDTVHVTSPSAAITET